MKFILFYSGNILRLERDSRKCLRRCLACNASHLISLWHDFIGFNLIFFIRRNIIVHLALKSTVFLLFFNLYGFIFFDNRNRCLNFYRSFNFGGFFLFRTIIFDCYLYLVRPNITHLIQDRFDHGFFIFINIFFFFLFVLALIGTIHIAHKILT